MSTEWTETEDWQARALAAEADLDETLAELGAVRALHQPDRGHWCPRCGTPYPCATAKATGVTE